MEAFQIIFNLAFLGVLAWWVLREKKREVGREDIDDLWGDLNGLRNDIRVTDDRVAAYHDYWDDQTEGFDERIIALEDKRATGGEIAEAIKTGAAMAQHHIDSGAKLVLDALARDGRVAPANYEPPKEAVNLDEDQYSQYQGQEFPDLILARNEKHAEQIGDRVLGELLNSMGAK